MTDEVRDAAKNLLDGGQNAMTHIMNRRHRHTVTVLDLLQERDDLLGFLRRHFHIAQHDFRQGVQTAHEHGPAFFAGAIQVKNVTTLGVHGFFEAWGRLPMSQGQIDDKLPGQIAHFTEAEPNVARSQFLLDFLGPPVAQEQSLADKDQHIIAERAASGRQPAQFLGPINRVVPAAPAVPEGFAGSKTTQRKSVNRFTLGFVDL